MEKVAGKVTKNWPPVGTNYVYRLDWDDWKGRKYYYFGESYKPQQRLKRHQQLLKHKCFGTIKMTILKTYKGPDCHAKSIHMENKLIWSHHWNKKGWEWRDGDKKTDIPRMYNKWTLTHQGWIKKNKPKVYEACFK